ncbi:MAG: hypothetical protein LBT13_00950 [Treponema sp.]|jgi:hypothetical protein|nr:hypothetical protein [Treponema sp.]
MFEFGGARFFEDIRASKQDEATDIYRVSESIRPPWEKDKAEEADIRRAAEITEKAEAFIREHARTDAEKEVACIIADMMRDGRVRVDDTAKEIGYPVYGYFHPEVDPETGEDRSYICLDREIILTSGTAEAIDTLTHEGYHAAQRFEGHENDSVEEETRAWNMGLEMSNKYRDEQGETIVRTEPYTQEEVREMGYYYTLGPGVFTELLV